MFQNWLFPLSTNDLELAPHQLGSHLLRYTGIMPDLKEAHLALIGIGAEEADTVRAALYPLSFPYDGLQIADLGNVRKENTAFLIPLMKELLESNVLPIIIGAQPEHALAQYKAFQSLQYLINLVIVGERIAYDVESDDRDTYYLKEILESPQSRLFHLSFVGAQSHFVPPAVFEYWDTRQFDCLRLGSTKANLAEAEPLIRDGDLMSLNLSALKSGEVPGLGTSPSGFTVEEACQIARYAGMSDKLKTFGLFGYRAADDPNGQAALAAAQMLWYFMDGFYNRMGDFPASMDNLTEYVVEYKSLDYQLTFWRSDRSTRWWMQVPVKTRSRYQRHRLVPCSYADYQLACQDELPDRLLAAIRRFA